MNVDFRGFEVNGRKKRASLFIKRPENAPIPEGMEYTCVCDMSNKLTGEREQHCVRCGIRMVLQENHNPDAKHWTFVRVGHFFIDAKDGKRTAPKKEEPKPEEKKEEAKEEPKADAENPS